MFFFWFHRSPTSAKKRLSPSLTGRRLCCATTPWTDSSPSPSSPLVSLLLGIRLITQKVQHRDACRGRQTFSVHRHEAVNCTSICIWSYWSKPSVADCVPLYQCFHSGFCHVCVKRISNGTIIQDIYSNYIYCFYLFIFIEIHRFFKYLLFYLLFYTELHNAHNKQPSMLHQWRHSIFLMVMVPSKENNHNK